MEFIRENQSVGAGSQFTGLAGAGRFEFGESVIIRRITLNMGGEAKNWSIYITDSEGVESIIDSDTTDTTQNIVVIGDIPIVAGDYLRISTSAAVAAMSCSVVYFYN